MTDGLDDFSMLFDPDLVRADPAWFKICSENTKLLELAKTTQDLCGQLSQAFYDYSEAVDLATKRSAEVKVREIGDRCLHYRETATVRLSCSGPSRRGVSEYLSTLKSMGKLANANHPGWIHRGKLELARIGDSHDVSIQYPI